LSSAKSCCDYHANPSVSCSEIGEQAWISDHVECYLARPDGENTSNFCDLSFLDISILSQCVDFSDRFSRNSRQLFRDLVSRWQ